MLFDLELIDGSFGFDMVYPCMEEYGEAIPKEIKKTLPSSDVDTVWDSAEFARGEFRPGTNMWDLMGKKLPHTSWLHRGFSVWKAFFRFQTPDRKDLHICYDLVDDMGCQLIIGTDDAQITLRQGPSTDYESVCRFFDENKEFIRNHLYGTAKERRQKRFKAVFGRLNPLTLLGR